jgi:hypothetical protein
MGLGAGQGTWDGTGLGFALGFGRDTGGHTGDDGMGLGATVLMGRGRTDGLGAGLLATGGRGVGLAVGRTLGLGFSAAVAAVRLDSCELAEAKPVLHAVPIKIAAALMPAPAIASRRRLLFIRGVPSR